MSSYGYGGNGRRVTKTTLGLTAVYVCDAAGQMAAEYAVPSAYGTRYLTSDALGSTRLITTAGGSVDRNYDYLPFGEEIRTGTAGRDRTFPPASPPSPGVANAIKVGFTGKERDAETGSIISGLGTSRGRPVGQVRATGRDVVPTRGRTPNHATVTGLTPRAASELLTPAVPNPAKVKPQ